ncbi:MAG: hypothetical protein IKR18_03215 [Bacteroidaceae bacterium]|nr:hypothetical protein [Bacteroidaceae bacterium]
MLGKILKYSCGLFVATLLLTACGSAKKVEKQVAVVHLTDEEQSRFDAFFLEAVRQKELGNIEEAFDLYNHCLEINPDASAVLYEMFRFYMLLNQPQKSLECLQRAVAIEPSNYWYKDALASYYVSRNMIDEGIAVYEDISRQFPDRSDALGSLLSLYEYKSDYSKVISTLDRIEVLEGKNEKISIEKFKMFFLLGNRKKAFSEIESLVAEYPNDDRYRNTLGQLYLENKEPAKAYEIFTDLLRNDSTNGLAQISMLSYYEYMGMDSLYRSKIMEVVRNPKLDGDSRLGVMQEVIEMNEKKGDSIANVLFLDSMLDKSYVTPDMARLAAAYSLNVTVPRDTLSSVLEKVVKITPDEVMPVAHLLQWAIADNDTAKIIALCRPASEYHPEIPTFSLYLAIAYFQSNRNADAIDVLEKATSDADKKADPAVMTELYALLGDLYHEEKMTELAYEAYDSALQYKPDNIAVLNNYAYFLSLEDKELDKAEEMSYRVVKAEPSNWTYLDTYAWVLFKQGRYSEGKIYIDEALKNGGREHADIIEHAGDLYYYTGDVNGALKLWKEALDAGSESKTLRKKIKLKKYIQ